MVVQWIVGLACSAIWGRILAYFFTPIYRKRFSVHALVVGLGYEWHVLASSTTYLCVSLGHLALFSLVESFSHLNVFNASGFYLCSVLTTGVFFSIHFVPSIIRWEEIISNLLNDSDMMKKIVSEAKESSDHNKTKR
ncbi:MAG: hypothetical protein P9L99_01905 [Candidatus Lernaella stagnicola]|nr:hypothetical protein [Candidatus Lernaella stagnicola]